MKSVQFCVTPKFNGDNNKILVDAVPSNHAWIEGGTNVWTGRRGRVIALHTAVPTKLCDKDFQCWQFFKTV